MIYGQKAKKWTWHCPNDVVEKYCFSTNQNTALGLES